MINTELLIEEFIRVELFTTKNTEFNDLYDDLTGLIPNNLPAGQAGPE